MSILGMGLIRFLDVRSVVDTVVLLNRIILLHLCQYSITNKARPGNLGMGLKNIF